MYVYPGELLGPRSGRFRSEFWSSGLTPAELEARLKEFNPVDRLDGLTLTVHPV
jgi:hypothetical protein